MMGFYHWLMVTLIDSQSSTWQRVDEKLIMKRMRPLLYLSVWFFQLLYEEGNAFSSFVRAQGYTQKVQSHTE